MIIKESRTVRTVFCPKRFFFLVNLEEKWQYILDLLNYVESRVS